ncbi:unnamed protein product [Diamesa hyperborea]
MDEQPMPSTSKAVHIRDLESAMRKTALYVNSKEDQESATEKCSNTGANKEPEDVEMESIKENQQIPEQPTSHRPKTAARKDLEAFLQQMLTRKNACTVFCNADDNNNPQDSTTLKSPVYQIVNDDKSFSPPTKRKFKY